MLAYQTGLRVARARYLLDTTTLTDAEVAAELGYSDPLYFSRLFRRTQGQSPRDYRQRPRPWREASTTARGQHYRLRAGSGLMAARASARRFSPGSCGTRSKVKVSTVARRKSAA